MGLIARVFLLFLCLEPGSSVAAPVPVFTLERSTNRNQLVYQVELSSAEPVTAYWRMLEDDGHREELTSYERANLYGVKLLERSADEVTFSVRALPELPIKVSLKDGVPVASLPESGVGFPVKSFFAKLSGFLIPGISSIEVTGETESAELVRDQEHHFVIRVP